MAERSHDHEFRPDYAVHPGETLRETLEAEGLTQAELARRTGLSRKTINGIVNGRESVTPDSAVRFEQVFNVPATFWMNLQVNHDLHLARQRLQFGAMAVAEDEAPYGERRSRRS